MVEVFQLHAIAAGHDSTGSYAQIEAMEDSTGRRFAPVDDLGKWNEGIDTLRGDGIQVPQGETSFTWVSGFLTLEQWYYLYHDLLSDSRSGLVTVKTRLYNPASYSDCNATLYIGNPPNLQKGTNEYPAFRWEFSKVTTGAT